MNALYNIIEPLQGYLFEVLILPLLYWLSMTGWADEAYDATGHALLGLLFILIIYLLLRPLEALLPVEQWQERNAVRVDVLYTFLMRSGLLPLVFFLLLDPMFVFFQLQLHAVNIYSVHLEGIMPWLQEQILVSFVFYVIAFDFFDYVRHRLQHRFSWWWGLHCIHHSQRQLNLWSDERNHIFDNLIKAFWFALLAIILGVPGGQFLFIVLFMKLIESLSHANARISFGSIMGRVLVSPTYHRLHHSVGIGHEGKYYGCNFATLFPVWDIIFRTANYSSDIEPTGILDQLNGENYGEGFFEQQYIGFKRMFVALMPSK